jgi:hypothetical protein
MVARTSENSHSVRGSSAYRCPLDLSRVHRKGASSGFMAGLCLLFRSTMDEVIRSCEMKLKVRVG